MSAELKFYRFTADIQMDSDATANAMGQALSLTMQVAAGVAVDESDSPVARVILGKSTITNAQSFTPQEVSP